MKIKKRDLFIFILGVVTWVIVDMALNWEQTVKDFEQGFKDGIEASE
jgi:hypothetical protein